MDNKLFKIENMCYFLLSVFIFFLPSFGCAAEKQSCVNTRESFSILGDAFANHSWGDIKSLKKAYVNLFKSGLIEYGSDRPIVYSTNISFTNFFKRICHETACDIGDVTGAIDICIYSTNEHCNVIAASKEEKFYCLLTPSDGFYYDEPFDPYN